VRGAFCEALVAMSTPTSSSDLLTCLEPGMAIVFGGNRVARVPDELAAAFEEGDRLVVVQATGALLHVRAVEQQLADTAVARAARAFGELRQMDEEQITAFFDAFAVRLEDGASFAPIAEANAADVTAAATAGRSTTRLELTAKMRADMVAGLRAWRDRPLGRDELVDTVVHEGWRVEQRRAPLGVVGFVFEGRPNVFADATGVLRSGNTVVFRIGSDALGTARAIVEHALAPALAASGLPAGSAVLLDSPSRATGWALFSNPQLALAVARGSGTAVQQLGAVARQAGVPVSLHGTGGSWLVAGATADASRFAAVVRHSLDRKVCNTLNVCCIHASRAADLVPVFLDALDVAASARGANAKLHVVKGSDAAVPSEWFATAAPIQRAAGDVEEPRAELLDEGDLGVEWEWEGSPEVSLVVVDSVEEAVELFNRHSPRFGASLVSEDADEHDRFWASVDSPFVGDGFTRWVDGQFTLDKPELGLSNWQSGRLFARSGILSGDSVHTVRLRAHQIDPELHR
jgi:glutamate-5-semialdehyde dehydrogenase